MAAYITLHDIKTIRASTVPDCGPHITFQFEGAEFNSRVHVTVFLPDVKINQHVIDLINQAMGCLNVEAE